MASQLANHQLRERDQQMRLALTRITYLGSQPWPFPRSLMIGFAARAEREEVSLAEAEIETARWVTREQLRAELATGAVSLPPHTSIARRMIEDWLAGTLLR